MSDDLDIPAPTPIIDAEKLRKAIPIWEEVEDATRRHAVAIREAIPSVIDISTQALRPTDYGYVVQGEVSVEVSEPQEYCAGTTYCVRVKVSDLTIFDPEAKWDDGSDEGASELRLLVPDEARLLAYALFKVADQADELTKAEEDRGDTL